MGMALTSHWHLVRDRRHALVILSTLKPCYVRVSSLQKEVISSSTISAVSQLAAAGYNVIPVVTSEKAGTLTDRQWVDYCNRVVPVAPISGGKNRILQFGNEWMNSAFYGADINVDRAYELTRIAVDIFRSRYKCIIIAGGITNEFKTASNKMAARKWIERFIELGAENLIDYWALHHYEEDAHEDVFTSNVKFLNANSKKPVVVTETGSLRDPEGWYKKVMASQLKIFKWCWYCFNGHAGYNLVNDDLRPANNVYKLMQEDAL